MSERSTRTHLYHADANALGGRIERPFDLIVPVQAPLSMPAVGGYASARADDFRFQGILSISAAETQVAGSFNEQNGSWTTLVSASVEGLNVLNVVTADRVVAQISTEHPREGYTPKVSFVGTQFVNLRVGGQQIDPVLDLGFCDQGDPNEYPKQPCILNQAFLNKVADQRQGIGSEPEVTSGSDATVGTTKAGSVWNRYREWLQKRYPVPQKDANSAGAQRQERGMVQCSLVQRIQGDCPGKPFGHVLVIPEFGKVFLAELFLDRNSFHLVMLRFELGCPTQGVVGVGDTRTNGSSFP